MTFNYEKFILDGGDALQLAFENAYSGDSPASLIQMGVVQDVFYDLSKYSTEDLDKIIDHPLVNRELINYIPRNSCTVRLTADNSDVINPQLYLCFPFFPPHISMPINPGETVWILDLFPEQDTDILFWMCRVPTVDYVDDINFTHIDRVAFEPSTKEEQEPELKAPEFPNGGDIPEKYQLHPDDDYDNIYKNSLANKAIFLEPVPRYTKRPGDLVFQGSNNTLISLGTDRGYTSETRPKDISTDHSGSAEDLNTSNASILPDGKTAAHNWTEKIDATKEPLYLGTIDIVAGRGQETGTKPSEISNSRKYKETLKNFVQFDTSKPEYNRYQNPAEGDPDFVTDKSRAYISMKTMGDKNFGLSWPKFSKAPPAVPEEAKPYIILKSDEIRFSGRSSIRLLSEEGNASIQLLPASHIAIQADRIVIGSGDEKGHGEGDQVYIGDGATEPMVLGNVLLSILDQFMEHCQDFAIGAIVTPKNNFTAIGSPAGGPSITAANFYKAAVAERRAELKNFLSKNAKTK